MTDTTTVPTEIVGFNTLLARLDSGNFHATLTDTLQEVTAGLRSHADARGKAVGKITVEVTLAVEGDTLDVAATMKTTMPKARHGRTVLYTGDKGGIYVVNPRQQLLPLRDVTRETGTRREI